MKIDGWKKNILLTVVFVAYLVIGAAVLYGIENDLPPPAPDRMTMLIIKAVSEKQMKGIQMGMAQAVPQVTQGYKGKTFCFFCFCVIKCHEMCIKCC